MKRLFLLLGTAAILGLLSLTSRRAVSHFLFFSFPISYWSYLYNVAGIRLHLIFQWPISSSSLLNSCRWHRRRRKIGSQSLSFFPEIRFYRQKWGSIGRRSEAYRWKKRNINKRRSCESLIRFCSCHNWPPPSPPYARRLLLPLCPFIFFLLLYISFHWHSNPPCASSPTSFPAAVYLPCLLHFASNRAN